MTWPHSPGPASRPRPQDRRRCSPPTPSAAARARSGRPLLPLIAKITTEDELLGLTEYAPPLTAEVLLALHDGLTARRFSSR